MTVSAPASTAVIRPQRRRSAAWPVLAVLASLPVAALSVFRAIPAEWPTAVVQLLSFTPWLVIPAGAALLLGILSRRAVLVWLTAALMAVQLFWLFPLDHGRSTPDAGVPAVQLTAMNINSEFGQADAAEIVRLVRENGVTLLTVQEHSQALEDRLAAEGLSGLLPNRISDSHGRRRRQRHLLGAPFGNRGRRPGHALPDAGGQGHRGRDGNDGGPRSGERPCAAAG